MFVEIDQAIRPPELGNKLSSVRNYLGSFDAITSIFSIEGDFARSSAAFSIKAWATLPFRCASRPESSANVSKIPYLDGPILIANHDTVFDTFADDSGRNAHLNGKVAQALKEKASELLAKSPSIEKIDVIASKLPK